ncbi:hypothetical protein COU49_01365 [Candidatus Nomurabacteria bacterium CG10_big_fil_rev_8_21_14_0_10_35_16]|uniref:Uncharacterized protein n=1 Tax=Candidatus Nomurabacteria bacterium CG10_big_fil_rev_8_21_14_0_10_35_16 TaxID=1974731 RepID=A0A2H0TBF5_9BACT|nr:MAG: hypothetical protein COU49_01365 [Candidatus Nomurabacteria bacterium CG10_big_fil_rev_8_21_14_0_10_35_16]
MDKIPSKPNREEELLKRQKELQETLKEATAELKKAKGEKPERELALIREQEEARLRAKNNIPEHNQGTKIEINLNPEVAKKREKGTKAMLKAKLGFLESKLEKLKGEEKLLGVQLIAFNMDDHENSDPIIAKISQKHAEVEEAEKRVQETLAEWEELGFGTELREFIKNSIGVIKTKTEKITDTVAGGIGTIKAGVSRGAESYVRAFGQGTNMMEKGYPVNMGTEEKETRITPEEKTGEISKKEMDKLHSQAIKEDKKRDKDAQPGESWKTKVSRGAESYVRAFGQGTNMMEKGYPVNMGTEEVDIQKEVENLTEEEKEEIAWGLDNVGFKVEQKKNNFFAKTFSWIASLEKIKGGSTERFCEKMKESYTRDEVAAKQKLEDVETKKKRRAVTNVTLLTGNVAKVAALIPGLLSSPARYLIMAGALGARISDAAKEARLGNEAVIEKTRIEDAEKAAEEAWQIYRNAIVEDKNHEVSAEGLKKAYIDKMPKDLLERLERDPSVANGLVQRVVKWDLIKEIEQLNFNIKKIEDDTQLSPEKKENKKQMLREQERNLMDYDRIITQYGTVDGFAMSARYAKVAGKAVMWTGIALSVSKLIENMGQIGQAVFHSGGEEIIPPPAETPVTPESIRGIPIVEDTTTVGDSAQAVPATGASAEAATPGAAAEAGASGGVTPDTPVAPTQISSVEEYIKAHPEATHEVHRSWYDNNSEVFDKNELKTHWGGENGTGVNAEGKYVLDVSKMTAEGSFHGNLSANAQELLKEGKLKFLISATSGTQNQVFELPIDVNGQIVIDPNTDIGKMFFTTDAKGHAVFTGRFGEVAEQIDDKNNFRILSTIEGSHPKVETIIPKTPEAIPTPEHVELSTEQPDVTSTTKELDENAKKIKDLTKKSLGDQKRIAELEKQQDGLIQAIRKQYDQPSQPEVVEPPRPTRPAGPYNYVGDQRAGVYDQFAYQRSAGYNMGYNNTAPIHDQFAGPSRSGGENLIGNQETEIKDAFKEPRGRGQRPTMENTEFDNSTKVKDIFKDQKLGGQNRGFANATEVGNPWAFQKIEELNLPTQLQENIFDLKPNELGEIYRVHERIIPRIAPDTLVRSGGNIDTWWSQAKNLSAREILERPNPGQAHLADYLKRLTRVTGLQPAGRGLFGFGTEQTVDNFMYHALQKATEMGKLSELR